MWKAAPMSAKSRLCMVTTNFNYGDYIDDCMRSIVHSRGSDRVDYVVMDGGSTDKSLDILRAIAAGDERVRVISLRRNYGQTAAMSAGIDAAQGEILIPMDADLQNDPKDIARLLDKLNEGYDVVSGWRKNRKDKLIMRKIPSQIANRIISWIGGVPLHDYGCSLKAYRREVIDTVQPLLSNHFNLTVEIPLKAIVRGHSYKVIPISWRNRKEGESKLSLQEMGSRYAFIVLYVLLGFLLPESPRF